MFKKLDDLLIKFNNLNTLISDPKVIQNKVAWKTYTKELSEISDTVTKYNEYKKVQDDISNISEMILCETDRDMKVFLEEELSNSKFKLQELEKELKLALLPKDENDDKNVIIEIRAGAGGEEASLFASDLYKMYTRYADKKGWKVEEIENNSTELKGIKEVVFLIKGKGAFSNLKYESGVHRVQRIPNTESQGRIHTSTATVAVLPEIENIEVNIDEKDLKIDTYRSSGAGGQYVNKTESCIRMTHIPTGIVVTCQDERSQIKNKEKALKILKNRLYTYYQSQYEKNYSSNRKIQIGTGDRSERIRTYNFPQGRVTDHRINFTSYNLEDFMLGNIEEMLQRLSIADREAKLIESK